MSEELDPTKYHVLTSKNKILAVVILVLVLVTLVPISGYYYYNFAINRPSQAIKDHTIVVEKGESVTEIADKLYEQNIINSKFLFLAYVSLNNLQNRLQAGVYEFPVGISLVQATQRLQQGKDDKAITFLEGWRLEEIAKHASETFDQISYEKFIIEGRTLEGELFPDTYFFNAEIKEEEIIKRMNRTFNDKASALLSEENLAAAGLTRHEAIIFASIVEREINIKEDRATVAGILIKRWRNGELVGADATTQYAVATIRQGCSGNPEQICPKEELAKSINWWPTNLTVEELQSENSYNTRKVLGIPPAPIANPGLGAIEAVVNPVFTDYNYYLSDKQGITRYAATLEEHNANVATYLY